MKLLLVCVCLLQAGLLMSSSSAHELSSSHSDLRSAGKPRTLFARRGAVEAQRLRVTKPVVEVVQVAPRCSRLSESCFPHFLCCDSCASCFCRFFNTVCYCWRLGRHCQKHT